MKFLREPLMQFLFIGAAIYLLYGLYADPVKKDMDNTIIVSAGDIEGLATSWLKRWNRMPTAEELTGLIRQQIKETVLYRKALDLGLDKNDIVIRRRMAQKMEFLAQDLVLLPTPTDEELQTWFAAHIQDYQDPVRYTFTQIFIDPDKRGDVTLDDAQKIKTRLIAQGDAVAGSGSMGDEFMLQDYYPERSQTEIQKLFGSGFAESLAKLSPGQWHGPVLSGYGVHLVYVSSRIEPPPPELKKVGELVLEDWQAEKREELNEQFFTSLKDQYTIVIEEKLSDVSPEILQEESS